MRRDGFEVEEVREGRALVLVPKLEMYRQGPREYVPSRAPVFYNPLMKENRDLAIIFLRKILREAGRGIDFGEPMTGTGVRGIRAVLEGGVGHAWINDISGAATRMAEMNAKRNGASSRMTVENRDAKVFCLLHDSEFDYLDLDPFGSPSPFLESSIQAVRDGGTVAVTATDAATLCGVYPDKAVARYGGRSVRTIFPKEFAVRLLIYGIVGAAARLERGAVPLLAYFSRHYARVYCGVRRGNREAKRALAQTGHILYCGHCYQREGVKGERGGELPRLACPHCGGRRELAGPIWLGAHSDPAWAQWMRAGGAEGECQLEPNVAKMLQRLSLEDTGVLGSYPIAKISQYGRISPPRRQQLLQRLKAAGIEACESACEENAIKTRADISEIMKLL